jgi:hypothetical protein
MSPIKIIAPSTRSEDAAAIRAILSRCIKNSRLSREQIADQMSAALGLRITVPMLAAYTAESKKFHRWPAEFDVAFCQIVGDYSLLAERVRICGMRMIGPDEEALIEVGRAFLQKTKLEDFLKEALELQATRLLERAISGASNALLKRARALKGGR